MVGRGSLLGGGWCLHNEFSWLAKIHTGSGRRRSWGGKRVGEEFLVIVENNDKNEINISIGFLCTKATTLLDLR